MRIVAGAILILAATILYAVRWLGNVLHDSAVAGSDEAGLLTLFAVFWLLGGLGTMVLGLLQDRTGQRPCPGAGVAADDVAGTTAGVYQSPTVSQRS